MIVRSSPVIALPISAVSVSMFSFAAKLCSMSSCASERSGSRDGRVGSCSVVFLTMSSGSGSLNALTSERPGGTVRCLHCPCGGASLPSRGKRERSIGIGTRSESGLTSANGRSSTSSANPGACRSRRNERSARPSASPAPAITSCCAGSSTVPRRWPTTRCSCGGSVAFARSGGNGVPRSDSASGSRAPATGRTRPVPG